MGRSRDISLNKQQFVLQIVGTFIRFYNNFEWKIAFFCFQIKVINSTYMYPLKPIICSIKDCIKVCKLNSYIKKRINCRTATTNLRITILAKQDIGALMM